MIQMRRMQKRIKQKSAKMYIHSGQAANVNTTPQFHQQTWVKTGEVPTILPREKHRSPLTTKAALFSTNSELHLNREGHYSILL